MHWFSNTGTLFSSSGREETPPRPSQTTSWQSPGTSGITVPSFAFAGAQWPWLQRATAHGVGGRGQSWSTTHGAHASGGEASASALLPASVVPPLEPAGAPCPAVAPVEPEAPVAPAGPIPAAAPPVSPSGAAASY